MSIRYSADGERLEHDGKAAKMRTTTTLADGYLSEMRDRMRRIETRLTKFMNGTLEGPAGSRPAFGRDGSTYYLHLPSMECSLAAILDAVPPGLGHITVEIRHKTLVASVKLDIDT